MGHFLRTAVEVVGFAVAIAAAIPTGGTSLLAAGLGVSASTAALIAVGTEVAVAGFEAIAAKKPASLANPMDWQSDPEAGVPHIAGRMFTGGQIVYRQTFGKDNINETINTVYSTGPIKGFEGYYVSGVLAAIDAGGHPAITDGQKIFVATQLGRQPEPTQLGGTNNPGITTASKLSGLAASTQTFTYDTKGGNTLTTEPQTGFVVLGTPVYDPRKDSTYPGGNGTQRWNDETTWSFTGYGNPGLKALSYLIGYRHNGNLVIGVGLPITSIIVSQFVEMANVCDANGWTMGARIMSTDQKWTVFTQILQAGGATPLHTGALTGCLVNTPKVSLATFEIDDILGDWSVQGSQSRRARINSVVPRYMAEQSIVNETTDSHGNVTLQTVVTWGIATAGKIVVAEYVAEDGAERQKPIDYPFVTGVSTNNNAPNQVAQLARYDIENAREFGPVKINMKPRWMGYRAGDVITGGASLTELGLVGQDIMLLNRQFNPSNYTVSMTARSETAAKHPFALGQTTTAPPTPMLSGPPLIPVPSANSWAIVSETVSANGTTIPALVIQGATDSSVISGVVFEYRESTGEQDDTADWIAAGVEAPGAETKAITGVKDGTAYQCAVSYQTIAGTGSRLILGPVVAGQTSVPWESGVTGPGKPADGATVGSPAGTDVAGREAAALVGDVDLNAETLLAYQFDKQTLKDYVDGLLYVSGVPVNTAIATETSQRIDGENAIAQQISLIGAANSSGSAFVLNLTTTQVGNGMSLLDRLSGIDNNAEAIDNVTTTVQQLTSNYGAVTAAITNIEEVITTPSGGASAKAVFQLDANKHVVGYAATNDGTTGAIVFSFDSFNVQLPNGTSLLVADSSGVKMHSVEIDTLKVGSVTTTHLQADAVSGITVITGSDRQITPTTGEVTVLETSVLTISDGIDGKAQASIAFDQDALQFNDAGIQINVYVDIGSGYSLFRTRYSGIGTGHGDTYWRFPVSFSVPIITSSTAKIKVTATASRLSDKFADGGGACWVRSPEITVVQWGR